VSEAWWGNLIILAGGLMTWTANWLLGDKYRWGWLIKLTAIVCYTVAPVMMGLWMAIIVNGVTAFTQVRAFIKWK
jgi:hypothetical protein